MPPVWFGAGNSFLESAASQQRQARHHLYSSARLNTRATHIQCCPSQPGGNFIAGFFTVKSPAIRVRGATASGNAALFYGLWLCLCQSPYYCRTNAKNWSHYFFLAFDPDFLTSAQTADASARHPY